MGATASGALRSEAPARAWHGRDEATKYGRNGKLGWDGTQRFGVVGMACGYLARSAHWASGVGITWLSEHIGAVSSGVALHRA
jgi:hypothetical protein